MEGTIYSEILISRLQTAPKIFGGEIKSHILMFVPKTAEDFQDKMDQFKKASEGFKGKVRLFFLTIKLSVCFAEYIGV